MITPRRQDDHHGDERIDDPSLEILVDGMRLQSARVCLLLAIPVDLHVVRGPAAGDDVGAAVAVEVGGESVLAGHAAVVDGVPVEGERVRAGLGVEHEDPGPRGPAVPGLFGSRWPMISSSSPSPSRLADQTAWPHWTGSAMTWPRPESHGVTGDVSVSIRVDDDLKAVPGLDRGDVAGAPPRSRPTLTSLDPLDGCDSWLPVPMRVLVHRPRRVAVEHEHALPARHHDLVAMVAVDVDELKVVDRVQRRLGDFDRPGLAGRVRRERRKTSTRTPSPFPQFGPFVPRPCKAATTSCFLPVPLTSPQRRRCSVGSSKRIG